MEVTNSKNRIMDSQQAKNVQNKDNNVNTESPKNNFISKSAERLYAQKLIHQTIRCSDGNMQLQGAIIKNLQSLLDLGANINHKDEEGLTALHLAIDYRMGWVINFLIKNNAKLYVRDKYGNSIIHYLIEKEFEKLQKYETYEQFNVSKNPLCDSIQQQSENFINWMVAKGSVYVDSTNENKETPLHLAARYNLLHALPILLKYTRHTTHVNKYKNNAFQVFMNSIVYTNSDDLSPFTTERTKIPISAYKSTYVEQTCEEFLKIGFSVDSTGGGKNSPLHIALNGRKWSIVKIMLKYVNDVDVRNYEGNTALNILASYNRSEKDEEEIVRFLVSKGADVHKVNNSCFSPIINAVRRRNLTILKIFKEHDVDFCVSVRNENLLHHFFALKCRTDISTCEAIFDLLVNEGCDVNAKNKKGMTPLHIAAGQPQKTTIIEKLIKCGVDVNCKESVRDETALHIAVQQKWLGLIKLLIKYGAEVNVKNKNGQTPLHQVTNEIIDAVKYLILHDADINIMDNEGLLPLQSAIIRRDDSIVKKLLQFGADINENVRIWKIKDYRRFSPFVRGHLIRLETIGRTVLDIFKVYLTRDTDWLNIREDCLKEIERLKSYKIDDKTSLYDFLRMNRNTTCAYANNEKLKEFLSSAFLSIQFPMYHLIISSIYYMSLRRREMLAPAKNGWYELTKIELPDLCVDEIISNLSNLNLKVMGE